MSQRLGRAALTLLLVASPTLASGFYFGENGAKALTQGGAFAGQADDLTAIEHNPAGLAQQQGYGFLLDVELLRHDINFQRKDPGGVVVNGVNPIQNGPGPFFLPNLGLSYGSPVAGRRFTLAFGVYGPPSVGKYGFPVPNYAKENASFVAVPRKYAAERYALIDNDVIILYPSLAAAYELHPRFSVGLAVQYVYSAFKFRQAAYSGLFEPTRQRDEDPDFDSIVTVDMKGRPSVTGILGVMVKPTDQLSIGASFRPRIPISATGTMNFALGEIATGLGTVVTGNQADFTTTLPLEAKVGAHFQATDALGLNADFVYQGWDSVQELLFTPNGISTKIGSADATLVAPIHIPKHWVATFSGRLGASYALQSVTLRAGAWYETEAAPDAYTNIDFLHFSRLFVTAGVGYHVGHFEILAGGAFTPTVTKEVGDSEVRAQSTDPATPGGIIGVGTYSSGGWVATAGVRGSFGNP